MQYVFDRIYDRKGTGCFKADGLEMFFGKGDLLPLWVADMDFAVAPEILEAWHERMKHPIFGYNMRLHPYYEAFINWVEKHFHWQIEREWIITTPGVVTGINAAIQVFTNPRDKILIQTPVYEQFIEAVHQSNRTLVTNPLVRVDDRYEIDFHDLDNKLEGVKLFLLCNPHNPVGRVWTADELKEILRLCLKHNVLIISDEIHADLVYAGYQHIPMGTLECAEDITISCYSPSKSFNLAGLCTSAIVIENEQLRRRYNDYVFHMHLYLGNTFGMVAFQTAYEKGEPWLNALRAYLSENRQYLLDCFNTPESKVRLLPPEATYLGWLDFSRTGLNDRDLRHRMLNEAHIALNSGVQYGSDGSRYMRMNFGCPRAILVEACQRIHNTFD